MYWKIALILLTSLACSNESEESSKQNIESGKVVASSTENEAVVDSNTHIDSSREKGMATIGEGMLVEDTIVVLDYMGHSVGVEITAPLIANAGRSKTILLLHGWNLPPNEWCEKSDLCDSLSRAGFHIVKPDFGKSTYQWDLYPETIEAYRKYPNRKWMYDDFIPAMQALGLFDSADFNAVIGLSTGGRGAALYALEHPEIFDACVALSADFDHSKLVDEPINNGFYGPLNEFPERWKGRDNIHNRAEEWKVPIYLGHGLNDKMCDVSQTKDFEKALKNKEFSNIQSNYPKAGHNYDYWRSETTAIVKFLREIGG